jgi:hypothetical protein
MAGEELKAIGKEGLAAMGEDALHEGRRHAGVERGDSGPGMMTWLSDEQLVALPKSEREFFRGQRRVDNQRGLDSG